MLSLLPWSCACAALEEFADRLAIRELVDEYARCADRREAKGQMALFAADARFVVFMDAKSLADGKPAMDIKKREDLAPVFADLNKCMHSSIVKAVR